MAQQVVPRARHGPICWKSISTKRENENAAKKKKRGKQTLRTHKSRETQEPVSFTVSMSIKAIYVILLRVRLPPCVRPAPARPLRRPLLFCGLLLPPSRSCSYFVSFEEIYCARHIGCCRRCHCRHHCRRSRLFSSMRLLKETGEKVLRCTESPRAGDRQAGMKRRFLFLLRFSLLFFWPRTSV